MTVYKNNWAGYETYFIRMGNSGQYAKGIALRNFNGKWKVDFHATFYRSDLRNDREHFPIVGRLNLEKLILEAAWKMLGENAIAEECEEEEDGK